MDCSQAAAETGVLGDELGVSNELLLDQAIAKGDVGAIQDALVMDVLDSIADRVMVRTGEELTVIALSRFENSTHLKRYMRRNQDIERTLEEAKQQSDLTMSDVHPDNELEELAIVTYEIEPETLASTKRRREVIGRRLFWE
ncbi:Hypothetical predicted protein [Olea europaea subsp. europaea]|uniref:Uncharacterized protein n=1 Tax=Olea europaea subsp. europaea TaxID=158383 RepID=A0A8S0RIF2_OLEEU|nr:Hypothetical predicted protein [Olea europaea subsp. europaea]